VFFRSESHGLSLQVQVKPGGSRDRFEGVCNDRLQVRLTAPPVGGAANNKLRKLLGKRLRVAPGRIQIVKGQTHRQKVLLLEVSGTTKVEVSNRLMELSEQV